MQRLFTLMKRLEGSLVNVLIEGESGTGKELIARALHDHSTVSKGPFIALNCGALDRSLVRSELFGHKKGAFTGALGESIGAFAEADGGTLFLDEIGELPLDIQPVLLRTLESGAIARVGESKTRPVKVRVIAATHRSLSDDVTEGLFRADLYYRLMVVTLSAPPLRNRLEDVPLLAAHIATAAGIASLDSSIVDALSRRSFPGNVRELKHAILAYSAVGELPGTTAAIPDQLDGALAAFLDPTRPYAEQKEALIERMTRIYLQALMEKTAGNRSEAARIAELQRGYVRRLLEKYGLD
jgi:DNA-binding NtrC family response regulator